MEPTRAYFFGNHYLSSIQQGIQALHCIVDMMKNAGKQGPHSHVKMIQRWAEDDKTVILCSGGNHGDLQTLNNDLVRINQGVYPCGYFNEDYQSLNETITCVGIVLPERVYEMMEYIRTNKISTKDFEHADITDMATLLSEIDFEIAKRLCYYSLAH